MISSNPNCPETAQLKAVRPKKRSTNSKMHHHDFSQLSQFRPYAFRFSFPAIKRNIQNRIPPIMITLLIICSHTEIVIPFTVMLFGAKTEITDTPIITAVSSKNKIYKPFGSVLSPFSSEVIQASHLLPDTSSAHLERLPHQLLLHFRTTSKVPSKR